MKFTLENRSGYNTADLARFFARGFRAVGVTKRVRVVVSSSPIRSRGCADVGGSRLSIALAPPSRFSLRRLARLFIHEAAHIQGVDHQDMPDKLLYSRGPTPGWARESRIRYEGRAPDQLRFLR